MAGRLTEDLHFFIKGRVQGVGFRRWIAGQAPLYGLSGWVRNRKDGSVEVTVRGRASDLAIFLKECARGVFMSSVYEIVHTEMDGDLPELEDGLFDILADA